MLNTHQKKHIFLLWFISLFMIAVVLFIGYDNDQLSDFKIIKITDLDNTKISNISNIMINNKNKFILENINKSWWLMPEKLPANRNMLTQLLRILQQGKLITPKTDNQDFYASLGLDSDNAITITYNNTAGEKLVAFDIGTKSKVGDGRYIRLESDSQTYVSNITLGQLTRKNILEIPNKDVKEQAMTLRFSNGDEQDINPDTIANDDFMTLDKTRIIFTPNFINMLNHPNHHDKMVKHLEINLLNQNIILYSLQDMYYVIYSDDDQYMYEITNEDAQILLNQDNKIE